MPRNKDLKRVVRARMEKTGESYTAARAVVIRQNPKNAPKAAAAKGHGRQSPVPEAAAPRAEWPKLAGMSDDAVRAKTGHTWAEWVGALDDDGAYEWRHRDIVRHLRDGDHEGVTSWWAQTITVGYERIRGLRAVHQRPDGSFDANKSRTYPVSVSTLYEMIRNPRRRKTWLPSGWVGVRTATPDTSIRADWEDGTQVNLFFSAKGASKSTVSVQHAKLAARSRVDPAKAFWHERLDALGEALRQRGAGPKRS